MPVCIDARIKRRRIKRHGAVVRRERVHRDQSFRWPVETGRVIETAALGVIAGNGACRRWRGRECAKAVQHAGRRHDLCRTAARRFVGRVAGLCGCARSGQSHQAAQHVDECAGQGEIRPARVSRDMEEHDQSLAAALGGDERGAVGKRRPGSIGELRVGLGQHLAGDGDVGRDRHAVERALARESGELLRLVPAQAAAERAAAAAQLHRHELVVGAGEVRPGKAHKHAAIVDPFVELIERLVDVADIGKDQHRQFAVEELGNGFRRSNAFGKSHVGERIKRARKVVGRADQRLRTIRGRSGYDADRAPPPALVQELHSACRALADNFEACDVVANFDGEIDHRVGFAISGLEVERCLAQRQALEIDGVHHAEVARAGLRAQNLHGQRARCVVGSCQRMRDRQSAFDDAERVISYCLLQAVDKRRTFAEIDAVRQPHDFHVRCGGKKALDERQGCTAVNAERLRLDLLDLHARSACKTEGDVAIGLRQRQDRDAAIVGFGARDHLVSGSQARVPGRCRGPAVVEHDQQRCGAVCRRERRVPQRSGGRDDDQGGQSQSQQREPPGRARWGFFFRGDLEQQARRRKIDTAGARRNQPQQPPQHGQTEQAEQH